jgi:uncharacterized RDD family membrane protein YckC
MKCPKCGYLGFETGDKCRNCGYDFSLSTARSADPLDLTLDQGPDESKPPLDLDRIIGAPASPPPGDLPLFDDAPLITGPLRPRAPLGVRRATPEIPRARSRETRTPAHADTLFESAPEVVQSSPEIVRRRSGPVRSAQTSGEALAGAVSRILAALVDVALLLALDASVLYFTLRLVGLSTDQAGELPILPLMAFILLLNIGYFIAFTAVGGQSIGKMAFGIKVISQEEDAVPIGRATLRTLAYFVSALPLGAGFLPGVISADRLALHDRLAHTRVVRPSST